MLSVHPKVTISFYCHWAVSYIQVIFACDGHQSSVKRAYLSSKAKLVPNYKLGWEEQSIEDSGKVIQILKGLKFTTLGLSPELHWAMSAIETVKHTYTKVMGTASTMIWEATQDRYRTWLYHDMRSHIEQLWELPPPWYEKPHRTDIGTASSMIWEAT